MMPNPSATDKPKPVTFSLQPQQIYYLDQLAAQIRKNTGQAMKKTQIIRAVLDAFNDSGLDLTHASSEEELKLMVQKWFPKPSHRSR